VFISVLTVSVLVMSCYFLNVLLSLKMKGSNGMLYKIIQKLDEVFSFARALAYCRSVEPENNDFSK
jgi:hypothetical protein